MLNAFLAIAICAGFVVIVGGAFSFLADAQSDAPSEDSGKFGAWLIGVGWIVFWGSISGACAHGGHSLTAIWIGGVATFVEVGVAALIWWNAQKMAHG